jgi:hypothetical protein
LRRRRCHAPDCGGRDARHRRRKPWLLPCGRCPHGSGAAQPSIAQCTPGHPRWRQRSDDVARCADARSF